MKLIDSTPTIKFYQAPDGSIVIGVRGTKDTTDIKADALIPTNRLETSTRFKKDLKDIQAFQKANPNHDYYATGHSLGGAIVDLLLEKGLVKSARTYNPAIETRNLTNENIQNDRVFAENDALYALAKRFLTKVPEIRQANRQGVINQLAPWLGYLGLAYDKLQGHKLGTFTGGKAVVDEDPWADEAEGKEGESDAVADKRNAKIEKEGKKRQSDPLFMTKSYPENYSDDATRILGYMSFSGPSRHGMDFGPGVKILGSMSLRSQQWAGDYDGYEIVEQPGPLNKAVENFVKRFKEMVAILSSETDGVWVNDIKAGSVEEWRVIPKSVTIEHGKVVGWNARQAKDKLAELSSSNIITDEEFKKAMETLKEKMSPEDLFEAKGACKFHILRWTPADIAAGKITLRNKNTMRLQEAIQCPSLCKMDVISWVQGSRYTDFSVIYEFKVDGKTINPDPIEIIPSLEADVAHYWAKGKYFKALKRQFALCKVKGDVAGAAKITPILNSDLGRLYMIVGDIGTLLSLMKLPNVPASKLRFELNQFHNRMANVWTVKQFLGAEPALLKSIDRMMTMKPGPAMAKALEDLEDRMDRILQDGTKMAIEHIQKSN